MPIVPPGWPPFVPRLGRTSGMHVWAAWIVVGALVLILIWAYFGP